MARQIEKIPIRKNIFSKFKLAESYTSLILGAVVVLVAGILFISFVKVNRNMQTSSTKVGPTMPAQTAEKLKFQTSSTYTIKPGDDLWSISENVYKDGSKWVEIAKINKLEDPEIIHSGNRLVIPTVVPNITQKESVIAKAEPTPKTQSITMQNNSITENAYKIKEGDNLWDICVRAYGDGYKWVDIAKVNNLENPNLIYPDNTLKIPR